jgi:SNF2 family DNA or RNA helicase
MELRFVITLSEHRIFGQIFSPYLIKKEKQQGYYSIHERVAIHNLDKYSELLLPEEVQLVRYIEEYSEPNIVKVFSKKKVNSREFFAKINKEQLDEQIRPFIEKRMAKCIDILLTTPVPVYVKVLQNNLYEDDRVTELIDEGSTVFNFIRSSDSFRYFLSIEHNNKQLKLTGTNGIIFLDNPACILINNSLFVFRDIDGKKLIPFLNKEFINVPHTAEKKFFETFVRNTIKKYKVNAQGFSIKDIESKPEAVISVERDLTGRFYLVLKFIYSENGIYYANRKTEQKVTCEFNGNDVCFTRLQRDYNYENDCVSELLSMGLVNQDGPYFQPLQKQYDDENSGYHIINWINFNSNLIQSKGFNITSDKLEKNYYLNDFAIKIEVSEKNNDWFDIDARIEFAGFRIPFSAFAGHILNGNREFVLPDRRIMILPEEWFGTYRDMLSFARIEDDNIQLDKQHFPLLRNFGKVPESFRDNLLSLIEAGQKPEIVPSSINAELRHYQIDGYSWLHRLYKNNFGACLADDMGLGKTLQTLTLLTRVIDETSKLVGKREIQEEIKTEPNLFSSIEVPVSKINKASLIVVPTSLVHNWLNESKKFTPDLIINTYTGPQRGNLQLLVKESDLIITSYGILRNDLEQLTTINFLYLVLDESQTIKNPGSKTYQSVLQIKSDYRIVLTGTPIENSLTDLWSQINFLNQGLLGSLNFFKTEFQIPIEKNADGNKRKKLQQLIAPFILRRSKDEVATELPPVNEQVIYCNLNEQQELYYEREKSKARNLIIEKTTQLGYGKSSVIILQSLTRLRQIANHPALVDEDYYFGSGKFEEITRNLENLWMENHKALVFSSFVKHLDIVAEFLNRKGIDYAWLTGETQNREKEIQKFQENSSCPFFLISLKAGGVGLNLTAADYVFILDPWWNPAAEIQAISRVHRIGQEKHVFVYRFIARNTLEEKIIKLQERKAELADTFINNSLEGITQEQVMELFE